MTLPPDSDATPALLRLRALSTGGDALLYEAADEIERLRSRRGTGEGLARGGMRHNVCYGAEPRHNLPTGG